MTMARLRWLPAGLLVAGLSGIVADVAVQQNYPVRAVRISVSSGAGSIVGSEAVARAASDGYTLLSAISSMTIQPPMQKNLPFDPVRDLALDVEGIRTVLALRTRFGVPQKTLTDPLRYVDPELHHKAFGG